MWLHMNETKHNILIQALKFFSENDYDRASLNSIAEALGVTKGAIYHYFNSKDGLFEEVIIFMTTSINTFLAKMLPPDPTVKDFIFTTLNFTNIEDVMHQLWGVKINFDFLTFTNLMFAGMKKFPDIKRNFKESYKLMVDQFQLLIDKEKAEGIIKSDIDSRIVALEVITLSEGSILMLDFFDTEDKNRIKGFAEDIWNRIKA